MKCAESQQPNTFGPPRSASDPIDEARIFRIFDVEMQDVLCRLAESITCFIERVQLSFPHHATLPCRVSIYDNPIVRGAWQRVVRLCGDASALLHVTVRHYGLIYPVELEPFTCSRIDRPEYTPGPPPTRTVHAAELLGWFTPNEHLLNSLLKSIGNFLEQRAAVTVRQLGLVAVQDSSGNERVEACPSCAESDRSIARDYPLLIRDELRNHQLAIADATLRDLADKARSILAWRPVLESNRSLHPNWEMFIHSYMTVVQSEFRGENGGAKPQPKSKRKRPVRTSPRRMTTLEIRTMEVVGKNGGNYAAAARVLGRNPKTVRENYERALAKSLSFNRSVKANRLPRDGRGNADVEDREIGG